MGAKRKWLAHLGTIAVIAAVVTGCSSNDTGSTNASNKAGDAANKPGSGTNEAGKAENTSASNKASGTNDEGNKGTANNGAADEVQPIPADVQDSSDLPDWKGKQLSLNIWYSHGTGGGLIDTRKSKGDVVTPEIARVTGVTLDIAKSFDNAGQTAEVKTGLLAASNNWPALVDNADLKALVDADKVYDLTELLPKYAPNIMRKIPLSLKTIWEGDSRVSAGQKGKIYAVPTTLSMPLTELDSTIDKNKYSFLSTPDDNFSYIWVRDDILKKLYPNAKTQKELEAMYVQNGTFTQDQILDVPINSKADFVNFLYDIKKLGIKEGNQPVSPFYTFSGQDNWALMAFLGGLVDGYSMDNNYFTYWDKQTQKVEFMYDKPFFKESLRTWDQLLRDGVASKEALLDPYNTFKEKLDNGMYAVSYAWLQPDPSVLAKAGKTYAYRKVYLNIPTDDSRYVMYKAAPGTLENIAIFKDKVKPEDVPQVLRWLDFLESDAGEKLNFWGPRSAGLFKEDADGKRTYVDPELEQHMVYQQPSPKGLFYNLKNGTADSGLHNYFSYATTSKFSPIYSYDRERNASDVYKFFNIALVRPFKEVVSLTPDIYNYTADIPEADKAWKARTAFENALTKVIAASSDSQFEKLYNDFVTIAQKSGYTDELAQKIDAAFRVKNADNMDSLK
ncbi:hypothetical protein GXP70_06275 [Paenibacillus lycopersici]|uniref:Extracellular solute-binding protein n=1 Tax=Paenibacillus lycopersici TaxID=2704462 RepID=A0A6C0FR31_9BACL|nr:hypothetical protein [Paenibacillus lycopersici]QHT59596.1 hypothetical protein GXP70_06275 [Paenibacillus lycopersici]